MNNINLTVIFLLSSRRLTQGHCAKKSSTSLFAKRSPHPSYPSLPNMTSS